ncbi:MAG: FKBP-type peptidyl-prolyl cis-trans isomerase, partial [Bacteroidales bacterium]
LDTIPEERITPYELLVPGSTLKDTIYFISYGGARNDSVANLGDQVVLDYYGKYIDGTGFELRKEATLTVQKASSGKSDAVIDGLAEALRHVNPGEKVSVVIPYRLAYGSVDQNETLGDMKMPTVIVPAYSTLVFDLILHKIIPEY